MSRRKYSDLSTHDEAMARLCFVCAGLINEEYCFDVEKHMPLISRVLGCKSMFTLPGLTPNRFCCKCYAKLQHIDNGSTVTSSLKLLEWGECGMNCKTCALLMKRTKAGRKPKVSIIDYFHLPLSEIIFSLKIQYLYSYTVSFLQTLIQIIQKFYTNILKYNDKYVLCVR